jgi:hypothetical protein
VATHSRTPHSVVAVLEANIVRACSRPERFCKASRGISSSRLIGEQTKPVVGRSSCHHSLAFVASLLCSANLSHFKDQVSGRKGRAEKGRSWEFRSETSACVLCVRERICGVAAAVLVAALQLILGPRRHVPRRPAMVRRATEPLTANILAAGSRAGTGRQSCYSRLVAPVGGGTAPAPALSTSCGLC